MNETTFAADAVGAGHDGEVLAVAEDGTRVIDCRQCGYAHVFPLPRPAELENFYRQEFYQQEKSDYIARVERDWHWWQTVYCERLALAEATLPATRRRLLDVGCGPGHFLSCGCARGWQGEGIEPSPVAVEYCRRQALAVRQGFFDDNSVAGRRYDLVHMSEVLEHVAEPSAVLRRAWCCLGEGGMVIVCVPNDFSPLQRAASARHRLAPWWVSPRHHLNYFNRNSLERLINSSGFAVLKTVSTFPIDMFLLLGMNYIGDEEVGRRCHQMRIEFEQALDAAGLAEWRQRLYQQLAGLDMGREIVMYARKVGI
ncbi:MAG: class I SAM-dependent methyltransferase [Negativicutes bacterium]|nr:class I SAM-dependent methyltransferase [Negativicutes bacterium]